MLMMFGAALKRAPIERAIPFDNDDLMIFVSPTIAFRLCNIVSEIGEKFSIRQYMEAKTDVFGKEPFEERMKSFAEIMQARIERFFVTDKSDYLFFDEEEQRFIVKALCRQGLSCSVKIYRFHANEKAELLDFLSLDRREAERVSKFLSACRVRMVVDCREYYLLCNEKGRKCSEHFGYERPNFKKPNTEMDAMFKKYSKLSSLKSKEKVNLYFKKLIIKYHPDKEGGDAEICTQINSDFNKIKEGRWYNNLQDLEGGQL